MEAEKKAKEEAKAQGLDYVEVTDDDMQELKQQVRDEIQEDQDVYYGIEEENNEAYQGVEESE